jgi:nucleoside phosphorylase
VSDTSPEAGLGIVTALPIEFAAMRQLLDDQRPVTTPSNPKQYLAGRLPSARDRQPHSAVLTMLSRDGTRSAAAECAYLLAGFPSIRAIVMVGIACGIPSASDPAKHVRLGDLVVATEIIDYGHVRAVNGSQQLRGRIDGPSLDLMNADRVLQANEIAGERPWEDWLGGSVSLPEVYRRPDESTDVLTIKGEPVAHPDDRRRGRRPGFPRIHRGIVASGDQLVRDEVLRDELAARYGACALEMEGVGVAAGTTLRQVPWFMVRGIADYGNEHKNDEWHHYASLAAAAYVRALLGRCEPSGTQAPLALRPGATLAEPSLHVSSARLLPRPVRHSPIRAIGEIVDALLEIREILDNSTRPALITFLPRNIQTAVNHQPNARLELISLVRTCASFHDGQEALVMALRSVVAEGSMELAHAELVIADNWHGLLR